MLLPPLLPPQYHHYSQMETDEELLDVLIKQPQELLSFFESVAEFDSWCEKHPALMKGILTWATDQYFADRLSGDYAKKMAKIIHEHYGTLDPFIPLNIAIDVEGKKLEINSLLLGTSSDYFRQQLIKECRDGKSKELKIPNVSYEFFLFVEEYINTGSAWKLWRKTKEELLETLYLSKRLELLGLIDASQISLKRYLDTSNIIEMLVLSHKEGLHLLKLECLEFINAENFGVHLIDKGSESLALEFLDFKDKAMGIYEALRPYITHLIIGGLLTQDLNFRFVVNGCPHLIGIDIAHTHAYSELLRYMPTQLEELDISKCGWLNQAHLREIIDTCPKLKKLNIGSNTHLNYNTFSEIQHLRELKNLDISRSLQIGNDEFKLILKACREVTDFNCEDCPKVAENAFFDIGRMVPKLVQLNVARTNISDSSLIEIAVRCKSLKALDISRCANITNKGVLETVREAPQLKTLNIARCNIPDFIKADIKKLAPLLDVLE